MTLTLCNVSVNKYIMRSLDNIHAFGALNDVYAPDRIHVSLDQTRMNQDDGQALRTKNTIKLLSKAV